MTGPAGKILVAHRGAPYFFRENTIDSFLKAVSLGADMVEFDVRRTKDGKLVVYHDPFIIHGSKEKLLSGITFSQMQRMAEENGYRVPDLQEVLSMLSGKVKLVIELKEENCEQEVLELVSGSTGFSSCIFISFKPSVISALKKIDPGLTTGFLFDDIRQADPAIPADILCPRDNIVTKHHDFFESQKSRGRMTAVWTVDDSVSLKKFLNDPAIDIIITNQIDKAIKLRDIQREILC